MMNDGLSKAYNLIFTFDFMDNVDKVLKNTNILKKSFTKNLVTYTVVLHDDLLNNYVMTLKKVTYNQIKIEAIENDVEMAPVGTDKPLGSKSAIDEN